MAWVSVMDTAARALSLFRSPIQLSSPAPAEAGSCRPAATLRAPSQCGPVAALPCSRCSSLSAQPHQSRELQSSFTGQRSFNLATLDVVEPLQGAQQKAVKRGAVTAVLEPLRIPVPVWPGWGRAHAPQQVKQRTWDPIYDGYENGPSAVTEFLVNYSMVVADIWTLNGAVQHVLADKVPEPQKWLRQSIPFFKRSRSSQPAGNTETPRFAEERLIQGAGQLAGRQHLEEEMKRASEGREEGRLQGWNGEEEGTSASAPPGFSFSAAGLLFPYHLGVAQCLLDRGLITEETPLSGSSAGAIVCAVIAAGVPTKQAMQATKELARNCRESGTAGRLGAVLREFLEDFLPEDAHKRCSGRIRLAVTQVFRWPRGVCVDEFFSKEDLINALVTSSFIPGYLAPQPATVFRNRYCMDGGISLFMPPTSSARTVRVCAFPASAYGLRDVDISPDCSPEGRAGIRQLLAWALEPASDAILDDLFRDGYEDASAWASSAAVHKGGSFGSFMAAAPRMS